MAFVYLSSANINKQLDGIVKDGRYTLARKSRLPEPSAAGNKPIYQLRIIHPRATLVRKVIFLVSGIHARELLAPQILLSLMTKLVRAYLNGTDLKIAKYTYSWEILDRLLTRAAIHVIPLVNPDGRDYALGTDDWWRMSRNRNAPYPACPGTDINRNFGFMWDTGIGSNQNPCARDNRGEVLGINRGFATSSYPKGFTQPETRNVKAALDALERSFEHICYCDVHSYKPAVVYPWGHVPTQTKRPWEHFRLAKWDKRSWYKNKGSYEEYMPKADEIHHRKLAQRMRDGIRSVRGTTYDTGHDYSVIGYGAAGTSSDYVYSRRFLGKKRVNSSILIEAGHSFAPTSSKTASAVVDEVSIGLMEMMLNCLCPIEMAEALAAALAQL